MGLDEFFHGVGWAWFVASVMVAGAGAAKGYLDSVKEFPTISVTLSLAAWGFVALLLSVYLEKKSKRGKDDE